MKQKLTCPPGVKRALYRIAAIAAAVVLIAVFYLAVILGQPEDAVTPAPAADQPLLAPSPALQLTSAEELPRLIETFPAPVMAFLTGAGPQLNAGLSYDVAFENGFARVLELRYLLDGGAYATVQSIYPARALSLVKREGYTLSSAVSQPIAGLQAVRMEGESLRFHAQGEQALYVITLPKMAGEALSATLKALQLSTR